MEGRDPKLIGARIKALRETRGWEPGQLAYMAGISVAQVYRLELGERPNASAVLIARVARTLGTSVEYLLGMSDDARPVGFDPGKLSPELLVLIETGEGEEWGTLYGALSPEGRKAVLQIARAIREMEERYREGRRE